MKEKTKSELDISSEKLSLVQNSMIKSVWGLTAGGEEIAKTRKNKNTNKYHSVLTSALIEALNPENKDSIFKNKSVSDISKLLLKVNKNIKQSVFEGNKISTQLTNCGPLLYISSSGVLEKGAPIFSSSKNNLIFKLRKNMILERKVQVEKIHSSPYSLYKLTPLKKISLEDLQKELKNNFDGLKIMGIDNQNDKRKGKFLSQSYIHSQIFIFKGENRDIIEDSKHKEKIEIETFWKIKSDISSIVLFGRAGVGKVKFI